MCVPLHFDSDQHSADFGVLRPYWGLYSVICRDFKDAHVHILQRMTIPWSLQDHTAPVRVERRCRNCRDFFVESQCCPGLHPGPRELPLQMANSSGNSMLCLCADHTSRETSTSLLGFDLKQEKNKEEYKNWWEEGYESLKAKVSWILCSLCVGSNPARFAEIGELRWSDS